MRLSKLLLFALMCSPAWCDWSYKATLTYNHAQCGTADSANFTAVVTFNHASLKDVAHGGYVQQTDGSDILFFSDSALTTQVPSKKKTYDSVNGIGAFRVSITCSHTADGTIYVAVGEASPPSRTTTGTYDSYTTAAWPLGDGATLSAVDDTGNAHNGTVSAATATAGLVDGAAAFNGVANGTTSTYIGFGTGADVTGTNPFTASVWINFADLQAGTIVGLMGQRDENIYGDAWLLKTYYGYPDFTLLGSANSECDITHYVYPSTTTWHLFGVTRESDGACKLYIDGVQAETSSAATVQNIASSANLYLGADYRDLYFSGTDHPINGAATEFQMAASTARPASWFTATYNNGIAPGNIGSAGFWTWGTWTSPSAPVKRRVVVIQ